MGVLTDGFRRVLTEYADATTEPFAAHPLATYLRTGLRSAVAAITQPSYLVEGSPGRGRWAETPWVAIFDPQETTSAQHGVYVVYLFRPDGGGLFLTLNQGTTEMLRRYGARYTQILADKARFYGSLLTGEDTVDFEPGPIGLGGDGQLTRGYEAGSVLARYYSLDDLTSDEDIRIHQARLVELYAALLTSKDAVEGGEAQPAEPEQAVPTGIEGERYRWHLRAERNRRLATAAKRIHGDTCQVCGFNFAARYGEIGAGYIEAHHLTPFAELKGRPAQIDPRVDYAVVCPNCHRMLHTERPPLTVPDLRHRLR